MPPFIFLFLSPYPPLPGSSRFACFGLFPRPPGRGMRGFVADVRLRAAVGLLACHRSRAALSLRSFAFSRRPAVWRVVLLRSSASLLACSRRRFGYRAVSYSIPDDAMRITSSCGIRPVVNPACLPHLMCFSACHVLGSLFFLASCLWRCGLLAFLIRSWLLGAVVSVLRAMRADFLRARPALVPSGGSPLVPACLIFAAVCHDASPNRRSCLAAGRLPLRVLVSLSLLRFTPSSVPVPSHCFSPHSPLHRHAGRGDTMALRLVSRLCLLVPSARHLIRAVRHRMATGLGACLISPPRLFLSMPIIGAVCYPLTRPIRFPRRPVVLPPHHLIASSPRHATRGNGAAAIGGCYRSCPRLIARSPVVVARADSSRFAWMITERPIPAGEGRFSVPSCPVSPCSLFSFRPSPPPSPRLFSACLLELVPRPRAWDVLAWCPVCCCGWDGDLPANHRAVPLSRLSLVRYCCLVSPCGLFVRVLCIAAAGVALLAWLSYYVFVDGGMW